MDKYTEKYFFNQIKEILDSGDVEKIKPCLIFIDVREVKDKSSVQLETILHWSGNKTIGESKEVFEQIYPLFG